LKPGRVTYCVWCNDAGHIIDDGTIFCMAAGEYRLCTAERQLDWLLDSAVGFVVQIAEVTESIAALSLQGPASCAVLRDLGLNDAERLKPFESGAFHREGRNITISRTGFTGDLGYELWMDPQHAEWWWDRLMSVGSTRGLRPIGSRALNIARIEAGFLLPNVDFVNAERTIHLARDRSPLELGLGWLVDFGKGHFTGRRALLAEQARGSPRRLVGLDVAGNKPAHNALLYAGRDGRREVGFVTSATWSPTCKRNIALGIVDAPLFETGRAVWADIYLCRELAWERRMVRAVVVDRPFFEHERRRATPPGNF
jgi:aminomethyltransferase